MTRAIHQVLPTFSYGDAIGAAVRRTGTMLRDLGFASDVFADGIDSRLAGEARPAGELVDALAPGDAVLYHLSIGSPLAAVVERCGARLLIAYHNITPTTYYAGTNPRVTFWLVRGRHDLRRLAPRADLVVADSSFNLEEARAAGARQGVVIPPPTDLDRLRPRPNHTASPPTVLFVGRIAPNKRPDVLVRSLAALRVTAIPDARLALMGSTVDTDRYAERLTALADAVGVAGSVDLGGRRVDDDAVGDAYANAAVFATASEHEGFCVPLVEAMAFGLPAVAYRAGAVAETAAGSALLLDTHDPLVWAAALERVISDTALRDHLVECGRRRLATLTQDSIRDRLGVAVREAGITP